MSFPSQFEPPCAGSGLLHSWYRDIDPLPHVAEHEFQSCHVPQFPFTKYIKWNIRKTITIEKSPKYNCMYCLNHHRVYKLPSTLNICFLSRFYRLWTDYYRVYFLKTEKHPHFCRHCYPFRTYRTIQIWTANSMILLLLHKLCTQNRRDLILQMYLFYYLAKTAILNTHLHIFHYTIRWTSSLHYIHKLNRLLGQWVNAYTYNSNTYLGMSW